MLIRCALILALVPVAIPCAAAASLPAEIAVLARGQPLNINGLHSDTYALRSSKSPAELGPALERWWRGEAHDLPVLHRQVGEWHVLTRRSAARVLTAQWKAMADGGSGGYLSEVNLARPPDWQLSPLLKLPAAVRVHNFVQTQDAGNTFTQFLAESALDPAALLHTILVSARRTRWIDNSASQWSLRSALAAGRGACIELQRDATQVQVVIDRDARGSSLVISQVELAPRR